MSDKKIIYIDGEPVEYIRVDIIYHHLREIERLLNQPSTPHDIVFNNPPPIDKFSITKFFDKVFKK